MNVSKLFIESLMEFMDLGSGPLNPRLKAKRNKPDTRPMGNKLRRVERAGYEILPVDEYNSKAVQSFLKKEMKKDVYKKDGQQYVWPIIVPEPFNTSGNLIVVWVESEPKGKTPEQQIKSIGKELDTTDISPGFWVAKKNKKLYLIPTGSKWI